MSNRDRGPADRSLSIVRLTAVVAGLLLSTSAAGAEMIRVAVASNYVVTLAALVERFESASGHEVVLIPGSTGKHFAQIVQGAPFDVFFAADARRPRRLEDEGFAIPRSRFTYAVGRLVLWSPRVDLVDAAGRVLDESDFRYLAIANEELAPYGEAAEQVLRGRGLWESLAGRVVRGENVAQAFQFVASGNAQIGLVALAQLSGPAGPRGGSRWLVPPELHDPIEQQVVLLREGDAAHALLDFVRGEEARSLMRVYGYEWPRAEKVEGDDGG